MPVRLAVLGCGGIARAAHLPTLARTAGAEITAIADADPANLARAQALAPSARAERDVARVLAMPDVDAIVIALPPALHADTAVAALTAGKHVYIEKPLAMSVVDARRVHSAWEGSGLTAMMGFNYRFNPIVDRARSRVAAGAVGEPIGLRSVFATPRREMPGWKTARATGGGALLDLAVHHIDLARFLLAGEVVSVSADVRSVASDEDTAFLQLRLTTGAVVQTLCSLSAVEEDRIEIYGDRGKLTVDRYRSLRVDEASTATEGALGGAAKRLVRELSAVPYALEKRRAPMHDPSFPIAMQAFVRAVERRTVVTPTIGDGLRAIAVIEAAEQSSRTGRVVELDPLTGLVPSQPSLDVPGA